MESSIAIVCRSAIDSTAAKRLPSFQLPAYGNALAEATTQPASPSSQVESG
jgi:hypothetical protein